MSLGGVSTTQDIRNKIASIRNEVSDLIVELKEAGIDETLVAKIKKLFVSCVSIFEFQEEALTKDVKKFYEAVEILTNAVVFYAKKLEEYDTKLNNLYEQSQADLRANSVTIQGLKDRVVELEARLT